MKDLFTNFGEHGPRVDFRTYSEKVVPLTSVSGVLTIDVRLGTVFSITLTENITSILLTGAEEANRAYSATLVVTQHASSAKTVSFAGLAAPSGIAPVMTTTTGGVDRFVFETIDQGTAVRVTTAGQAFSVPA
jgi:hypothetical protein